MKIILAISLISASILTAACSKEDGNNSTVVRDVPYYRAHASERQKMLEKCQNNPGELMHTPDCLNADHAQNLESAEERWRKNPDETKE